MTTAEITLKNIVGRPGLSVWFAGNTLGFRGERSPAINLDQARRLRDFLVANVPDAPTFKVGDYVKVLRGAVNTSRNENTFKRYVGDIVKVIQTPDYTDSVVTETLDGDRIGEILPEFLELYTGKPVEQADLNAGDIVNYDFISTHYEAATLVQGNEGLQDKESELYLRWFDDDRLAFGISNIRRIYAAPVPEPVPFEVGSTVVLKSSTSRAAVGSIGKVVRYKDGQNGETNGLVRIDWVVGGIPDQEEWVFFRTSRFAQSTLAAAV